MKQHNNKTQTPQSLNTETAVPQQGKGISYPSQNSDFISQLKAAQLKESTTAPAQFKGHKPQDGMTVYLTASKPGKDDLPYTVIRSDDYGTLQLRDHKGKTVNKDWKEDDVWIDYSHLGNDVDMRMGEQAWTDMSGGKKDELIDAAKQQALGKILEAVAGNTINKTEYTQLTKTLNLDSFAKARDGEWQCVYEEGKAGGKSEQRIWQFTIDMDDPEATSWQEPHVGWEVKLLDTGKDGKGKPYPKFSKQQGHIWVDAVPEARGPMKEDVAEEKED